MHKPNGGTLLGATSVTTPAGVVASTWTPEAAKVDGVVPNEHCRVAPEHTWFGIVERRISEALLIATSVADSDREWDAARGSRPTPVTAPDISLGSACRGRGLRPSAVPVSRTLDVAGGESSLEREADQIAGTAVVGPTSRSRAGMTAPRVVRDVLRESGAPLDEASRAFFEPRFGHDFSAVRVHGGRLAEASAQSIHAQAYAAGEHIVLGPAGGVSRELLAHELAHVVQDRAQSRPGVVHRSVELRDVGRREQSGFARVPELIDRLNAVANGLVFRLDENNNLQYDENPYGTATEFERRMKALIDSGTPIPLRITNQSGLLKDDQGKFTVPVNIDDFQSGYVDIDDLLAADDLAFQTQLVHVLTERAATKDYSGRMGSTFTETEFGHSHGEGLDAETKILQDFFDDKSIRFVDDPVPSTGLRRIWTNSRDDLIREPFRHSGGLEVLKIEVRLKDGRTMTATEYRDFRASAGAAKSRP